MPKLSKEYRFLDLSDYGRSTAVLIADYLKDSRLTPIHITLLFTLAGLLAVFFILNDFYLAAGLFLILKSVLDAADGELSRVKNTPSYTGRFLDSISDFILNFLFIATIGYKANTPFLYSVTAFLAVELQGTLYNYYYVILRSISSGSDNTSRIFENKIPLALSGESQRNVNILFYVFKILYGAFDKIIFSLDKSAVKTKGLLGWFMSLVSLYGLGFQLLIIAVMLNLGLIDYIIPFFIYYTVLLAVFILIRKIFLNSSVKTGPLITDKVNDDEGIHSKDRFNKQVYDSNF